MREKNLRYQRWQDRHNHLFGKLLLKKFLVKEYGFGDNVLDLLEYTKFDRPYLTVGEVDFNISHTGSMVACAIAERARVGLDIEKCVPINKSDFMDIHSPEQWEDINASNDPQRSFFEYWTIKESLIKADGRGLSIPLDQIRVVDKHAFYGGLTWHLKSVKLHDIILACIAINRPDFRVTLRPFDEINLHTRMAPNF